MVPPPSWARSIEVVDDGAPIENAPRQGAKRRGTVAVGTRLPLGRRVPGDGCSVGTWVEIARDQYVCEEYVRPSPEAPTGVAQPPVRANALLPFRYAFVRDDATMAYGHPSDYFSDTFVESLGEGFGLIIVERTFHEGLSFVRTKRGVWVAEDSIRYARGSDFSGVPIAEGETARIGWALRGTTVRAAPRAGKVLRRLGRRDVVRIAAEERGVFTLADGGHVAVRDIAVAAPAPAPDGLGPSERWIDVDVASQTLIAYEGSRPVFTTLVSTGRDRPTHRTPVGTFRIWVKLATATMDDIERQDVERNYSIEGVPWVQYFEGSNGFHAAFWHDDFGRRKSHGCVNLSPRDARWLYDWTQPAVPPGWTAVLPTADAPGTLVRVR